MATYEKDDNELVFDTGESSECCCPICGGELAYGSSETLDNTMIYPWDCKECGAKGNEYGFILFDGHNVDFDTLTVDKQLEYTEVKTTCINGTLKVGDIVLSTIDDDCPCLPGRVTAIDLIGSDEHETDNETDDVHVDFSGDYGERRKREIVEAYADLYGEKRPYEEVSYEDLIMAPESLINITGIEAEKLRWIMESEENAIRYAYQVLRPMAIKA